MPTLSISTAFDSGAIEVVSLADHKDIQLKIRPDNASEFAQWFHFRLQGAAGLPVTVRMLNAGQSAYPDGWKNYRIVASYDRQHWFRLPASYDGQELKFSTTPMAQSLYFAYFEPYSHERHLDLIGFATESDLVEVEHLGNTLDGRDMTVLHITGHAQSATAKRHVWLIARQHPGETMAEWFVEGFLERLLDQDDPVSRVLLDRCIFHVVPNMNPDGAARGNLRTNAAGANLNREWQTPTLARSPEVYLVRQKMLETGVDLFLDAHGDENLPYNFVAGCEGNPGYNTRIEALEEAFKTAWLQASPDFQTAHGYERDAPGTANLTLATNWVGQQFDCLAYTIEMPFKDNANLPDEEYGWSGERSKKLGASVLQPTLNVLDSLR
ncbi:M14 family metallopeptidase [Parachitinimonas caeni]|uniref:M14-type cytosolic carboxypeptidase n=1 Tax=Parachitinimonas caeni TaxID=3031301 RepID=A0ABT7E040_9NEIS|nr:M14-type cytosolic carboxypeptidase [Parachitinimonas caeni]MDK2125651.1 M14-type cytosolic carboxypeptidase [Parachitinimonas caeni]